VALILFPAQVLTVESGPVAADAMEVLGGGASERSQRTVICGWKVPSYSATGYGMG